MAALRDCMSWILTSERSLEEVAAVSNPRTSCACRRVETYRMEWSASQKEEEQGSNILLLSPSEADRGTIPYSASNWFGRIKSAYPTSPLYAGTTSSAT